MITAVFVYGTLKQGECRHPLWPAEPLSIQQAWVHGALYGGPEYPAMTPGNDRVLGELWTLQATDMDTVLRVLDEIEGTNQPGRPDMYRRVEIESWSLDDQPLTTAYTYHYAADLARDGFSRLLPADDESFVRWPAQ